MDVTAKLSSNGRITARTSAHGRRARHRGGALRDASSYAGQAEVGQMVLKVVAGTRARFMYEAAAALRCTW